MGMSDWVDDAVDRLQARKNQQQKERDWQLYKASVLPDKASLIWKELVASIESAIRSFNDRLMLHSDSIFTVRKTSEKIEIYRAYFPSIQLSVYLKVQNSEIIWKKNVTRIAGGIHLASAGRFVLDIHDTGDVYILDNRGSPIDCERVSQILLEPIFSLI